MAPGARTGRWRGTVAAVLVVGGLLASIGASPGVARAGTSAAPPGGTVSVDRFVPVTPTRLVEAHLGTAPETLPVPGRAGLPVGRVGAVVLAVTARSAAAGAVTLWDGAGAPPAVPTLTTGPARTATTTALVPVGPDGRIAAVAAPAPADVTVDVTGWFPTSPTVATDVPARLLDGSGGPVVAGIVRPLPIGGRGSGSVPGGSSVLLAVRAAHADTPSGLTLWPGGAPQPVVPSVPVGPGGEHEDLVHTAVGADGQVDMALAEGTADVVVDLLAVVPPRSPLRALAPARVFDSRPGTVTDDGIDGAAGTLVPDAVRRVPLAGRGGVPVGATAVVAHLTAMTAPTGTGPVELRAWSDAAAPAPPGPAVVAGPGETRAGMVVLPIGPDGSVAMRSDGAPCDVAVDVQGWVGDVPPSDDAGRG